MKYCLTLVFIFLTIGCNTLKNPYSQFYKADIDASKLGYESENSPPKIEIAYTEANDFRSKVWDYIENNFIRLGESHFWANEGLTRDDKAVAYAKKLGASHILISRRHKQSRSGIIPITTPTQNTTYTHGNVVGQNFYGNINGNNFSGNTTGYSYSGTSTTYGSKTTNIPYNVHTYDVSSAFFVKGNEKIGWGIMSSEPSLTERKKIGTNKGVKLVAVIKGGAFFRADIIRDDIILSVNENPVFYSRGWFDPYEDKTELELVIIRNGETIKKMVRKI